MTLLELYEKAMRVPWRKAEAAEASVFARHEPTWFYIHPRAAEKLILRDTPAAAMTDTD